MKVVAGLRELEAFTQLEKHIYGFAHHVNLIWRVMLRIEELILGLLMMFIGFALWGIQ
jgi:hypothetical protein